jgi:predicted nucleic acid-binding protein
LTVVLDSWVILRYLDDVEPAAGNVAELLEAERPIVSWINLGEVFYVVRRLNGEKAASETIRDLRDVTTAETPTETRIIEAARIKADHPMAYADAFAAATAVGHSATLWTGDPELLLDGAPWEWRDLRIAQGRR